MRVVHIIPYYLEGLGYEENYLGFAQARQGVEVTIVTSASSPVLWSGSTPNTSTPAVATDIAPLKVGYYKDRGVKIVRLASLLEVRRRAQFVLRNLARTMREQSPDIVQLHSPVGLLTVQALWAAKRMRVPVVIDSHLCYFNLQPYSWKKRLYYFAFRRLVLPYFQDTISRYMPKTPDSAALLANELGVSPRGMTHVPLGVDISGFVFDAQARKRQRERLNIPTSASVAIFVGRVTPAKEVDVLIRASAPILTRHDLHLLIVGPIEQAYRDQLAGLVPASQRHRLHFIGFTPHDRLADYFSSAEVAVWPGDGAISIIEAIATGTPVVLSRSESTRHLVSAGNGLVFPRGDVDELRTKLVRMLSDRATMRQMSCLGRRLAEEVFDWTKVAHRTIEIYHAVLTGETPELRPLWNEVQS